MENQAKGDLADAAAIWAHLGGDDGCSLWRGRSATKNHLADAAAIWASLADASQAKGDLADAKLFGRAWQTVTSIKGSVGLR